MRFLKYVTCCTLLLSSAMSLGADQTMGDKTPLLDADGLDFVSRDSILVRNAPHDITPYERLLKKIKVSSINDAIPRKAVKKTLLCCISATLARQKNDDEFRTVIEPICKAKNIYFVAYEKTRIVSPKTVARLLNALEPAADLNELKKDCADMNSLLQAIGSGDITHDDLFPKKEKHSKLRRLFKKSNRS